MISRLQGVVVIIKPPVVVLDINGVGYEVSLAIRDFDKVTIGEVAIITTHMIVREDNHSLYGFMDSKDRDMFRELIKVNGIGAKVGLALISTYSCDDICRLIDSSAVALLSKAPGVGKKTAERLILELSGKLHLSSNDANNVGRITALTKISKDLTDALLSFGYTNKQVDLAIKELPNDVADMNVALKQSLQILSK